MTLSDIMDMVNSGATPQTLGYGNAQQAFQGMASPDAVLNSPAAQMGTGFAGITSAPIPAVQALQDQARRIATGFSGLSGEAKYAALRDIAAQLRRLQGVPDLSAGQSYVPSDVSNIRDVMERLLQNRGL